MRRLLALALVLLLAVAPASAFQGSNVIQVQNGQVQVNFSNAQVTNSIIFSSAATTLGFTNAGTAGQPMLAGTPPAFGALDLTVAGNTTGALRNDRGGTGLSSFAIDTVLLANPANTWTAGPVNNCGDATHALSYSTSGHAFGCQAITASSFPTQMAFGTNGDLAAGTNTIFASFAGTDAREAAVQMPINSTSRVWNNYRCKASVAPGGSGIVVELRKGACGSQAGVGATDCTIAAGATTCTGEPIVSAQSVATNGHCLDWSIVGTGTTAVVQVVCTVEQTG